MYRPVPRPLMLVFQPALPRVIDVASLCRAVSRFYTLGSANDGVSAGNNAPAFFTWWNGQQLSDLVATGIPADLSANWDAAIANGD